ncbi:LOB domain-containing protein 24-like [Impatiens glandulifera]|uniref:LOB domain-containing protein 24-like n=1 Tax=Impatiens glandulifera TaxID=253017 RepID=UPI001FB1752C|nr:LOB domain-containing protein 24-like [Impatiens glandulifera]
MVISGSCAACRHRRKRCKPNCVFKAYFPADNPQKFADIHKVLGARKVGEFIESLQASHYSQSQCQEAIESLSYESSCRINDPVFGIVSLLCALEADLHKFKNQLDIVNKEIEALQATDAVLPTNQVAAPEA